MEELDRHINQARSLPAPPRLVLELLLRLSQPNVDSTKVVRAISQDLVLTEKLLALCNSAYFAAATATTDLQEAITRLGFKQIYELVAVVHGARTLLAPQKAYGLEAGDHWRHSVAAAIAARLVAGPAGVDENKAFTAALLHDVGKIILNLPLTPLVRQLDEAVERDQSTLVDAEKKLLKVQHAEIGGRLLERWSFPEEIVTAVWFHHQPRAARPHDRLAACIWLGNWMALMLGYGFGRHPFALEWRREVLETLHLAESDLDPLLMQMIDSLDMVETLATVPLAS